MLWDTKSLRRISYLYPYTVVSDPITAISFYIDEGGKQRLMLAYQKGRILDWDVDVKSWIGRACRFAGKDMTAEDWDKYIQNEQKPTICTADDLKPLP